MDIRYKHRHARLAINNLVMHLLFPSNYAADLGNEMCYTISRAIDNNAHPHFRTKEKKQIPLIYKI